MLNIEFVFKGNVIDFPNIKTAIKVFVPYEQNTPLADAYCAEVLEKVQHPDFENPIELTHHNKLATNTRDFLARKGVSAPLTMGTRTVLHFIGPNSGVSIGPIIALRKLISHLNKLKIDDYTIGNVVLAEDKAHAFLRSFYEIDLDYKMPEGTPPTVYARQHKRSILIQLNDSRLSRKDRFEFSVVTGFDTRLVNLLVLDDVKACLRGVYEVSV